METRNHFFNKNSRVSSILLITGDRPLHYCATYQQPPETKLKSWNFPLHLKFIHNAESWIQKEQKSFLSSRRSCHSWYSIFLLRVFKDFTRVIVKNFLVFIFYVFTNTFCALREFWGWNEKNWKQELEVKEENYFGGLA